MQTCLNNPFQMSVRGGFLLSIYSQIQKRLNLIREGGQHFSNNSEIQKFLKYLGGGRGSGLIGNFPPIIWYKNSDASPKHSRQPQYKLANKRKLVASPSWSELGTAQPQLVPVFVA